MKQLIYTTLALFMLTAFYSEASAQIDNVGTSAANFLKIGMGARAQGMAGAYVAQANDATALYWNPSGIVSVADREVAFSRIDWIADIQLNYMATVFSLGDFGHIGVGITYLSMGEMKITNWEHPEGTGETFDANDLSLGLTWARHLTDRFSIGLTVKYIQEKINQSSASAYAMDIGTSYDTGFHGVKIGMALTNFGTKMRMSGRDLSVRTDPYQQSKGSNPNDVWADLRTEDWPLPIAIRIGTSIDMLKSEFMRITGNFDFYDYRDVDQMWAVGAETAFMNEQFFIRGGVTPYIEDEIRVSLGAGLHYMITEQYGINVDYAYSDLGILEKANRFSLAIIF